MNNFNLVTFEESLSIVIPLYNKEKNIRFTLKNIVEKIQSPNLQIIVVENESTDNSEKVASDFISKIKHKVEIELIHSKKGLGNALIKGFEKCKNDWIYFIPADFSFGYSELNYIIQKNIYTEYDLFIGSKSHRDSEIFRSNSRKFYSIIFNYLLKLIFSIPVNDTQGTILFRSKILNNLGNLKNEEYLITTEIIVRAYQKNYRLLEIPIVDLGINSISTVNPLFDGLKMLLGIIKLKLQIK